MKFINTIILLTFSFVSKGLASRREYHCGKQLADLLDLICSGRGFYWTKEHAPILQKRNAVQYLKGSQSQVRRRRGIVNECCENPCTPDQMESYCAVPPGVYVLKPTAAPLNDDEFARFMKNGNVRTKLTTPPPINTTTSTTTTTTTTTLPPPLPTTQGPTSLQSILANLRKYRIPFGKSPMTNLLGRNEVIWVRKVGPRPTRTPVILEQ